MTRNFHRFVPVLLVFLCLGVPLFVTAQDDEDDSKGIRAERFVKGRPADKSRTSATYRRKASTTTAVRPKGMGVDEVGITIWRFRRSQAAEKKKELIEEEDGQQSEWTLERVEEGTALSPGQRVRLSIESLSRNGYLYVIDREEYGDGTFGDPVLIFPTAKSAS